LEVFEYEDGGEQTWQLLDMGSEFPFKSITGSIFEVGFTDALLQMWAAFIYELAHGTTKSKYAACVTPPEAALSHELFTAALESQRMRQTVPVPIPRDMTGNAEHA
jgi:hypothetical protein